MSLLIWLVSSSQTWSQLIAVIYLYRLVQREFGEKVASLSVIYLALFPTAFYLSAIYTKSLFLACSVACIYYARTQRWWLAGLCGGLASLTRAQGVLLLIPVVWEYWQVISDHYAPITNAGQVTLQERMQPGVLHVCTDRCWQHEHCATGSLYSHLALFLLVYWHS